MERARSLIQLIPNVAYEIWRQYQRSTAITGLLIMFPHDVYLFKFIQRLHGLLLRSSNMFYAQISRHIAFTAGVKAAMFMFHTLHNSSFKEMATSHEQTKELEIKLACERLVETKTRQTI
ncbi:hypothetical protein CEXT_446961 [Caerostris extrusa]|uniref:Uncharacterized protein n=1 Tax=Caerostris extrusa TaxID=172846 RepID=A0AAV4M5M3_CAEEX|nr:hypothetical protein CEXT_446961 [Caerostris extrusa]